MTHARKRVSHHSGNRGIARTFQITSDGNVDIDFGHVVENPALAGVTVRQIDQVFTSAP
jgi:hypothetical protein